MKCLVCVITIALMAGNALPSTAEPPDFLWVKADSQLKDAQERLVANVHMGDVLFAKEVKDARVRVAHYSLGQERTEGWLPLHEVLTQDAAFTFFTNAIKKQPGNGRAYFGRATVVDTMRFPVSTVHEVLDDLDQTIQIDPHFVEARYWRGSVLARHKGFQPAIDDFTEIVKQGHATAWVHGSRGYCWLCVGDSVKALADLNHAVKLAPKEAGFYQARAAAQLVGRRPRLAIHDVKNARELGIEVTQELLIIEVAAHIENGTYDAALDVANEWIEEFPNSTDAYAMLALTRFVKAEYSEALRFYDRALAHFPSAVMALNGKAWVLATCPSADVRNGKEAVELARHASRLMKEDFWPALATLAAANAETGRFDEAVKWQERAIELAPKYRKEQLHEGLNLYESGKPFRSTPSRDRPPWDWIQEFVVGG